MRETASGKLSLRLTPDLIQRIDKLRPKIAKDPAVAGLTRVTRSVVVRRALLRGVEVLEQEYRR